MTKITKELREQLDKLTDEYAEKFKALLGKEQSAAILLLPPGASALVVTDAPECPDAANSPEGTHVHMEVIAARNSFSQSVVRALESAGEVPILGDILSAYVMHKHQEVKAAELAEKAVNNARMH